MKTAHQLARELLELPDLELIIDDKFCGKPGIINGFQWDENRSVVWLGTRTSPEER